MTIAVPDATRAAVQQAMHASRRSSTLAPVGTFGPRRRSGEEAKAHEQAHTLGAPRGLLLRVRHGHAGVRLREAQFGMHLASALRSATPRGACSAGRASTRGTRQSRHTSCREAVSAPLAARAAGLAPAAWKRLRVRGRWTAYPAGVSRQHKKRGRLVIVEGDNVVQTGAEQGGHGLGGAVSQPYPGDLWRVTEKQGALLKIRVFRHDHEPVFGGKSPHHQVIRRRQTDIANVNRAMVFGRERGHESMR